MPEYIEREATLDALRKAHNPNTARMAISFAAVNSVPAADVRPMVRGVWKFDDFDGDRLDYQCSICKLYSRQNYDFCPNCGASMGKE